MEAKRELWALLHGFESSVGAWKVSPLSDLDVEDLQAEVQRTRTQAQELATNNKHAILTKLLDRLEEFEPLVPQLQVCKLARTSVAPHERMCTLHREADLIRTYRT